MPKPQLLFVSKIRPVPVNSPHKGEWRGALMFSLICVWINGWVNNREAGDLRRYRGHYDVIVMDDVDYFLPMVEVKPRFVIDRKRAQAVVSYFAGMTLGGLCALFGVEYIRHARWCCPEMGQSVLNYHLSYCFLLAILAAIFCVASSLVCVLEFLEIRIQEKDKKHFAEMMRGIAVLESRMWRQN